MTSPPDGTTALPVRAVIFDWGGTLTPWHDIDLKAQWLTFAGALAGIHPEHLALADRVGSIEAAAWARGRTEHRSASLERILHDAGVDPAHGDHQPALAAYRDFWEPHTFTDPQVRPLWQGLHDRDIKVGVLSNTIWSRDYHRGLFERDGVLDLVHGDVYSSEIDHVKPHPEAFLAAARAVDVAPEDAVYVGDRLFEDVHGPQQVGMRAIWIPHSVLPADQVVAVQATPDAVARTLLDILTIIDEWRAGDPSQD